MNTPDPLRTAAELTALFGREATLRIATFRIRQLSFRISPETAPRLSFWALVMSRAASIELASGETARLALQMAPDHTARLQLLETRSRPQVLRALPAVA